MSLNPEVICQVPSEPFSRPERKKRAPHIGLGFRMYALTPTSLGAMLACGREAFASLQADVYLNLDWNPQTLKPQTLDPKP